MLITLEGMQYFREQWFPLVYSIISQQKGFISLTHEAEKDVDDCVNLCIRFENRDLFHSWWKDVPDHSKLIDALDPYRSRDYWEGAVTEEEIPSHLQWESNKPQS